jgi:hypothetical protein
MGHILSNANAAFSDMDPAQISTEGPKYLDLQGMQRRGPRGPNPTSQRAATDSTLGHGRRSATEQPANTQAARQLALILGYPYSAFPLEAESSEQRVDEGGRGRASQHDQQGEQ